MDQDDHNRREEREFSRPSEEPHTGGDDCPCHLCTLQLIADDKESSLAVKKAMWAFANACARRAHEEMARQTAEKLGLQTRQNASPEDANPDTDKPATLTLECRGCGNFKDIDRKIARVPDNVVMIQTLQCDECDSGDRDEEFWFDKFNQPVEVTT